MKNASWTFFIANEPVMLLELSEELCGSDSVITSGLHILHKLGLNQRLDPVWFAWQILWRAVPWVTREHPRALFSLHEIPGRREWF